MIFPYLGILIIDGHAEKYGFRDMGFMGGGGEGGS